MLAIESDVGWEPTGGPHHRRRAGPAAATAPAPSPATAKPMPVAAMGGTVFRSPGAGRHCRSPAIRRHAATPFQCAAAARLPPVGPAPARRRGPGKGTQPHGGAPRRQLVPVSPSLQVVAQLGAVLLRALSSVVAGAASIDLVNTPAGAGDGQTIETKAAPPRSGAMRNTAAGQRGGRVLQALGEHQTGHYLRLQPAHCSTINGEGHYLP